MFQQIGGLIGDIIPFGVFLYFTLIVLGLIKLKNKPKVLEDPSLLIKGGLLLGTIIFGVFIILHLLR